MNEFDISLEHGYAVFVIVGIFSFLGYLAVKNFKKANYKAAILLAVGAIGVVVFSRNGGFQLVEQTIGYLTNAT